MSSWFVSGAVALAVAAGVAHPRAHVVARELAQSGEPPRAQNPLVAAIDSLGAFDYETRAAASRTVRRAPASDAVPALTEAVKNHKDSYVRYRALVLLMGFDDKNISEVVGSVVADRNDRLRALAYEWYERHPASAPIIALVDALQKESSEFVRPALTRAVAAAHADPRARAALAPLILKGEDFFRSEVIQALGDYRAAWAAPAILSVAKLDGPLQDDAVLALGKIGDAAALPTLAELQKDVPRERQPAIAAASCFIGVNCEGHRKFLDESLKFSATTPNFQTLLRTSSYAVSAFAARGDQAAFTSLFDSGVPAKDPARAPIALALGAAAVAQPDALLTVLAARTSDQAGAIELLRDAFDMLEEDFAEEMFYVHVRRAYWAAAEGSPARRLAEAVLQKLEF